MFLELIEWAIIFTFATSFGCFALSYFLGMFILILIMTLIVKPQKGLKLDAEWIISFSFLSWFAVLVTLGYGVIVVIRWGAGHLIKLLDEKFNT